MKLVVWKHHLGGQILSRNLDRYKSGVLFVIFVPTWDSQADLTKNLGLRLSFGQFRQWLDESNSSRINSFDRFEKWFGSRGELAHRVAHSRKKKLASLLCFKLFLFRRKIFENIFRNLTVFCNLFRFRNLTQFYDF